MEAYEYNLDGKVYKLQTASVYSPSSKCDIPIYAFREYLMEGWEYLERLPDGKTVTINKATAIPFVISEIKVHKVNKQMDLEEMIKDVEMKRYATLEENVINWATEKGILEKATPMKQALKTLEEVTELIDAIDSNNREEVADALGDILVTIIIQAEMQDMNLESCLEGAYNIIAKRTGKMVNGQFVKDE